MTDAEIKSMVQIHGSTMAKDKRRIEVSTGNPTGGSNNFIDMEFLNDAMVNFHGYHMEFVTEPQDQEANANGIWAVWVFPGKLIQNSDLPTLLGEFGDEDRSQYLWGMGVWASANQSPSHTEFKPKTSRNMARDSRIVLQILVNGLTVGALRINTVQTGFVSSVK